MKKMLSAVLLGLLYVGCYQNDVDYTLETQAAKRIENTVGCTDGCSVVIGDSNVFWYDWTFISGNSCNLGIGGTQIQFVTDNMDRIAVLHPVRLIIWTGQNDNKRPMTDIQADYDKMFDAIKKLSCPVFVLSVHPYSGDADNSSMLLINDYLKSHDGDGYKYIDIYDDIEACGRSCYINVGHLSGKGFDIIKERVLDAI